MSDRSLLRAEVVEISGNQCEHPAVLGFGPHPPGRNHEAPALIGRCPEQMTEMAHITPRGMGHKGDRDVIENVMAACNLHARSTDDLNSPEWAYVPGWHRMPDDYPLMTKRQALTHFVNTRRVKEGWDMPIKSGQEMP